MRLKHIGLGVVLIMLAVGMTACGKRGALEPPPKVERTAEADQAAAEDAEVIEERKDKVEDQHDPFILDVLL